MDEKIRDRPAKKNEALDRRETGRHSARQQIKKNGVCNQEGYPENGVKEYPHAQAR
jgi:hypothetical protein